MAVTVDGMEVQMPSTWVSTQLSKGFQQSVVGQLKGTDDIYNMGEAVIPQYEGGFEVGYVGELEPKPVSDVKLTAKSMGSHKFAGIVVVSREFAKRNPAQMLTFIERDMQNAVARQIDYAIMYGKSARTGNFVPGVEQSGNYINATNLRTELNFANSLAPQVLAGYDAILNGSRAEFADPNGFAFDPRLRSRMAQMTQMSQQPLGSDERFLPDLSTSYDSVAGLRAVYGRTVSGRVGTNPDTGVRGFVGDWANGLRWGYVDGISIQRSNEATIVDASGQTIHLFQQNATALLIEFMIGWSVMDPAYFSAFDDKVAG